MTKKIIYVFIILFFTNTAFASVIKFAQITDVHTAEKGIKYGGRNLDNSQSNLQNAVKNINADKSIQYVFFTGDSVDKSQKALYEKFFNIANNLNKPYYMALGNHDVNYGFELTKKEALDIIKNSSYANQDGNNYAVRLNDKFMAVMLDGTFETETGAQGYFSPDTLNLLDNILKENKDKYILIFQHFPIVEPASEKRYSHPHYIINKNELLKVIKKYKNTVLISSGHYHVKGEFKKYGIRHFSTPALFLTPSYYRITTIDYDDKKINRIITELKLND